MDRADDATCELCERAGTRLTRHHLVPRERDGHDGPTAELCETCHTHVHTLYDNRLLARELHSVERLRARPEMRKFLRWVRKQDPSRRHKVRRSNARRPSRR